MPAAPVNLPLDGNEPKPCLVSLDKVTNNLVAVPVDDILIPMEIKDVSLTPEQHRELSEGRKVLVEGMTSKWGEQIRRIYAVRCSPRNVQL